MEDWSVYVEELDYVPRGGGRRVVDWSKVVDIIQKAVDLVLADGKPRRVDLNMLLDLSDIPSTTIRANRTYLDLRQQLLEQGVNISVKREKIDDETTKTYLIVYKK